MTDWSAFVPALAVYLIAGAGLIRRLGEGLLHKKIYPQYILPLAATAGALGIGRYREGILAVLLFEAGLLMEDLFRRSAKRGLDANGDGTRFAGGALVTELESRKYVRGISLVCMVFALLMAAAVIFCVFAGFVHGRPEDWIYRSLVIAAVACPGGLVMSVTLAVLGGFSAAAREEILLKNGNILRDLLKANIFVFDKTGTLTNGRFAVKEIRAVSMTDEDFLRIAAHVESVGTHGIARAVAEAYRGEIDPERILHVQETPGSGISADFEGEHVLIGSRHMMEEQGISTEAADAPGTVVYVAVGGKYAGCIVLEDEVREEAYGLLEFLREKCSGVLVMLTGDTREAGYRAADKLGMDYVYAELTPEEKLARTEQFLDIQDDLEQLVFVGSGAGDAEALACADIGIALEEAGTGEHSEPEAPARAESGSEKHSEQEAPVHEENGSEKLSEQEAPVQSDIGTGKLSEQGAPARVESGNGRLLDQADVVLKQGEISRIPALIRIAGETSRVVKQNLVFAIAMKAVMLVLAAAGYFSMWQTVLAELGIMVVVVLNAMGVMKYVS